jgi:hypothetical protein
MLSLEAILARCTEEGECLLWGGSVTSDGYPCVRHRPQSQVRIRRKVWELANDKTLADGLYIVDTCDRRLCCNPKHLKPNTRKQQMELASRRGKLKNPLRAARIARTKRATEAKLDEAKARDVFERYHARKESGETLAVIAADYDVHLSLVHKIGSGRAWAVLDGARGSSVFNQV